MTTCQYNDCFEPVAWINPDGMQVCNLHKTVGSARLFQRTSPHASAEPLHYKVAREAHETAGKLVQGDRRETHGDFIKNFEAIAAVWTGFMESRFGKRPGLALTARDVADMMVLLKMARSFNGGYNADDRVDLIGYGMIGAGLEAAENAKT